MLSAADRTLDNICVALRTVFKLGCKKLNIYGVADNFSELKSMVAKYAVGYDADRIYKPDLTALVIAAYELKYETEIPPAVVAASAVELVKRYSDEKSFSFVNGILSTLIKETNRG